MLRGTLARKHSMPVWMAYGDFLEPWVRWRDGHREADLAAMRAGIARAHEQKITLYLPLLETALAEAEAEADQIDAALASISHALAETERTGQRWFEAETQRVRAEILLKREPTNTAPAEEAFLTSIAVAQQQNAKSFELRAALALAKLYQSTGCAGDAHAVLTPALEGFSPTPEFPEIKEAQNHLAALAEADEVKIAVAARQRRLKLQTSYGQALLWSRGFAAEETTAAFTRANELATKIGDAGERFTTYYGLWVGRFMRGEFRAARETAETFRRDAVAGSWLMEAAVANRVLGMTCLFQGEFAEAHSSFGQVLKIYDPERDREAKVRFAQDSAAGTTAYLAYTNWLFGNIERARELIEEAAARAEESAHVPTRANVYLFKAMFEIICGNISAARSAAEILVALSQEHGIAHYMALAGMSSRWLSAQLGGGDAGATELRQAIEAYTVQGNKLFVPFYQGLLAEIENERQSLDRALARIDEALMLADQTGERWTDAFLYRVRGEILLKREPTNTAPAEEAFLTSIAVAQQQKAKSFELRAALSLAKLYQATGRGADARVVLLSALESFSPTPEFPEIEKAQTLLAAVRS